MIMVNIQWNLIIVKYADVMNVEKQIKNDSNY